MKAKFGNKIPWATIRENSSGTQETLSLVGLPGDMNYELFPKQPAEGDIDYDLVYLYGRKPGFRAIFLAVHRDCLSQLCDD